MFRLNGIKTVGLMSRVLLKEWWGHGFPQPQPPSSQKEFPQTLASFHVLRLFLCFVVFLKEYHQPLQIEIVSKKWSNSLSIFQTFVSVQIPSLMA